ncbi:MAG: septum formation initiator family protein [Rhodospirillaceae bacterium]|jgi:cell division protein FtsB|nr:septum formation initiator family protein [Rhodospirillaceae bacterium]MBT5047177.1 septum formation initiator family protein [Rhodospirillaceae bacterium]MBT5459691.1 septum formation initiator family protein [Rhodospirillaceae bacterium]
MSFILEIRRRGRHVAGAILGALLFAYFTAHAVQGDRGLLAWVQLKQQISHATADLDATSTERDLWERRISLLHSDRLDPDMLDERVRVVTGLGRKDEIVIFHMAAYRTQ